MTTKLTIVLEVPYSDAMVTVLSSLADRAALDGAGLKHGVAARTPEIRALAKAYRDFSRAVTEVTTPKGGA
jgi:hypothetical protein